MVCSVLCMADNRQVEPTVAVEVRRHSIVSRVAVEGCPSAGGETRAAAPIEVTLIVVEVVVLAAANAPPVVMRATTIVINISFFTIPLLLIYHRFTCFRFQY